MTALAPHLTSFFQERLAVELHASVNTCDSYAYAFKLLLGYASKRLKCTPSRIELEQIDAPLVVAFLNDLQAARSNGSGSRNARLAAIKSFMHYMEYRVPSAMDQLQRVLAIPLQKTDKRLVRHLTAPEIPGSARCTEASQLAGHSRPRDAASDIRSRLCASQNLPV